MRPLADKVRNKLRDTSENLLSSKTPEIYSQPKEVKEFAEFDCLGCSNLLCCTSPREEQWGWTNKKQILVASSSSVQKPATPAQPSPKHWPTHKILNNYRLN